MEEAPELISPRISFSHDLAAVATTACAVTQPAVSGRSDMSLMSLRRWRLPEPEFDFANAAAADVAPADRLFADGKLLPVPPLPPTPHARARPSSCRQEQASGCVKPPHQAAWPQQRPARSWTSPFSRSSSVNSTATAAPSGRFTCPFMRSRSAGSARDGVGGVGVTAGHRPHCKKSGGTTAPASNGGGGGARSVYYYGYGGGRNGSGSHGHGVRVSPVLNVTSIGTSVVNLLSYLLCDCGEKTTKNRGFGVIS